MENGSAPAAWRVPVNIALYVALLVATALLVVVALKAFDDDGGSDDAAGVAAPEDASGNDLHAAVVDAASEEVHAFVNVDYENLEESIEAVRSGATGKFAKEYDKSVEGLRRLMVRNKSVMTGEVIAAGIVFADEKQARVLVATKGTVRNVSTGEDGAERNLRIQVDLRYLDGEWLTQDLAFVS
jgi:hypothetical protein